MFAKGPHISIDAVSLVPRLLHIPEKEFANWPERVRQIAIEIAAELFLVRCNPFIPVALVRKSVEDRFASVKQSLAHHFATSLSDGLTMFWSTYEQDLVYKEELVNELLRHIPKESIDFSSYSLADCVTDATDLRLELPLLVLMPKSAEELQAIVRLANSLQFALVPRGGGSGATGGAIPARKRSVVVSLVALNAPVEIDLENKSLKAQAGVITNDAILAAEKHNLLFSVDPASKIASSIGGNIAENAGGPLCFEYGTTIDNLLSYRMVSPTGDIIEIVRKNHPRRAVEVGEFAEFEVFDASGTLLRTVRLHSSELRKPGLGKDVTNKALGGLPGVQKEGTDGIIIDGHFILHEKPEHTRVMVLEFYGRTMESCARVVTDTVALRDRMRSSGASVKMTALEEFNSKYVQVISYQKKSSIYEGDPISVLILQLESEHKETLDDAIEQIKNICNSYKDVDFFVAADEKEAEAFWSDRHKLSLIARRTSGFKINEDVVLPMASIPSFALFLESLNLEYAARAYRSALQELVRGSTFFEEEERLNQELEYAKRIVRGDISHASLTDEELLLHASLFFSSLVKQYPQEAELIARTEEYMLNTRICVASHMHAGDGNCHVNIPVNSNDAKMMSKAEKVAHLAMSKAEELGGVVTGEHGIGITKIQFLSDEKMRDFIDYKREVDPKNIFNPAKLTQKELPVSSFTFSFNKLIENIKQSGLPEKEHLVSLLKNVQTCTRCGKCKQSCPVYSPDYSLTYHPRNKNIIFGSLIEAIYYSQVTTGKIESSLLAQLDRLVGYCTACGRCMAMCPVKIASHDVALSLRAYLEEEGAGSNPLKSKLVNFFGAKAESRIPAFAKLSSVGQQVQNKLIPIVPKAIRTKVSNPLFSGLGPVPQYTSLSDTLKLKNASLFVPEGKVRGTVLYFTGCGANLFFKDIGLAGIGLLLASGFAVILPDEHMCCGYPMLASGTEQAFLKNKEKNLRDFKRLLQNAESKGFTVTSLLTSCGSCRDGMARHLVPEILSQKGGNKVTMEDVSLFLLRQVKSLRMEKEGMHDFRESFGAKQFLYHSPCHTEDASLTKMKAGEQYLEALSTFFGVSGSLTPGCCGESGLGAITLPSLYNKIRARKKKQLEADLQGFSKQDPVVVSCPSCKMGLKRILMNEKDKRPVLHTLELMGQLRFGPKWKQELKKVLQKASVNEEGLRIVSLPERLREPAYALEEDV